MLRSFRARLFASVACGAAILVAAVSLLVNVMVSEQIERSEERGLDRTRAVFAALQDNARDQLVRESRLVSDLPYFRAAAAVYDPELPPEEQADALATITEVAHRVLVGVDADLLVLTDARARPLLSVGRASGTGSAPQPAAELAAAALRGEAAEGVVRTPAGLVHLVAVPMRAGPRTWGALCLGGLLDETLAAELESMSGSGIALVSGERVLAKSPSVPAALTAPLAGFLGARAGEASGLVDSPAGRYRVSATPLPTLAGAPDAHFVVVRSEANATAFLGAIRRGLALVSLAAAALGFLFVYLFARRLTRPLNALVGHTERLAEGRLDSRIRIGGSDEFSVLGDSFNRMAGSIEESRRRLEETNRVLEERGAELERTNQELRLSRDETERVNRDLRDTHARLVQAGKMAAFGELGASIAHELSNPLAAIRGFAQLLQMKVDENETLVHRNLGMIIEASDHMAHVVQGLKDFARQSSHERVAVEMREVVDRTLAFLEAQLRSRKIRVVLDVEATAPAVVGDANQLQQVLTNLLSNARDAIGQDGTIRMATRAVGGGTHVQVTVTDSGPGIPEEARPRIFQSFYTTKPEGEGTGLGLAITQSIVQDHGGSIEADNAPGGGARFRVYLPTAEARPCWEMLDCVRECRPDIESKEECVVYRENAGQRCWEVLARASRDGADIHRPDCTPCPVYRAKAAPHLDRDAA